MVIINWLFLITNSLYICEIYIDKKQKAAHKFACFQGERCDFMSSELLGILWLQSVSKIRLPLGFRLGQRV